MLGAPTVTVKLQLLPDLRIEIRRGDKKFKSVVKLDPEAAGISEDERAKIFATFTGRRLYLLNKLSPAKQARAIIMLALSDKTGGESALEALLATKLASYELDGNGDLTTAVRSIWVEQFASAGAPSHNNSNQTTAHARAHRCPPSPHPSRSRAQPTPPLPKLAQARNPRPLRPAPCRRRRWRRRTGGGRRKLVDRRRCGPSPPHRNHGVVDGQAHCRSSAGSERRCDL